MNCQNCDRGLVKYTNEFCHPCKGTGLISDTLLETEVTSKPAEKAEKKVSKKK